MPQQGYVQHTEGSATLLPKTAKIIKRLQIHHKPIQSLHGKKVDGRRTTHSDMARRKYEIIIQKKYVMKFIDYMKVIYGDNMPVVMGGKQIYAGIDLDYIQT